MERKCSAFKNLDDLPPLSSDDLVPVTLEEVNGGDQKRRLRLCSARESALAGGRTPDMTELLWRRIEEENLQETVRRIKEDQRVYAIAASFRRPHLDAEASSLSSKLATTPHERHMLRARAGLLRSGASFWGRVGRDQDACAAFAEDRGSMAMDRLASIALTTQRKAAALAV